MTISLENLKNNTLPSDTESVIAAIYATAKPENDKLGFFEKVTDKMVKDKCLYILKNEELFDIRMGQETQQLVMKALNELNRDLQEGKI